PCGFEADRIGGGAHAAPRWCGPDAPHEIEAGGVEVLFAFVDPESDVSELSLARMLRKRAPSRLACSSRLVGGMQIPGAPPVVASAVGLLAAAVIAIAIPAARAARVDVMQALRGHHETSDSFRSPQLDHDSVSSIFGNFIRRTRSWNRGSACRKASLGFTLRKGSISSRAKYAFSNQASVCTLSPSPAKTAAKA